MKVYHITYISYLSHVSYVGHRSYISYMIAIHMSYGFRYFMNHLKSPVITKNYLR